MVNPDLPDLAARVGRVLRARRQEQGRSLVELAGACGLSKTALVRLEAGEGNPSLETLWKVAGALDVPLGVLLDEPATPRVRRIAADAGPALEDEASGMRGWSLLTDARERRTEVLSFTLPAGGVRESPGHLAGTEELVVCVAGELSVGPVGAEVTLSVGDAAWLAADGPHVYRALTPARALNWMLYPPAHR